MEPDVEAGHRQEGDPEGPLQMDHLVATNILQWHHLKGRVGDQGYWGKPAHGDGQGPFILVDGKDDDSQQYWCCPADQNKHGQHAGSKILLEGLEIKQAESRRQDDPESGDRITFYFRIIPGIAQGCEDQAEENGLHGKY